MPGEIDNRVNREVLSTQQEHMRCGAFRVLVEPFIEDAAAGDRLADFVQRVCRRDATIDSLHDDVARLYGKPQERSPHTS